MIKLHSKLIFRVFLCLTALSAALCSAETIPLSEDAKSLKKGIYQHYKGALYEVIGVAHHSETLEEQVMYRLLYGDYGYWVRPVSLFCEPIITENNQEGPRFRFLGEPGNLAMEEGPEK